MKRQRKRRTMTLAQARELFRLDRKTGALYWRDTHGKKSARADTIGKGNRYRRVCHEGVRYQAHLIVWLLVKGEWPPNHELDHRDRKPGRDNANRPSNLRETTRNAQNYNTKRRRDNRSGLKWVRTKGPRQFQATVQLYLGTFTTPRQAHEVARRFVREHHGEFFNPGLTP